MPGLTPSSCSSSDTEGNTLSILDDTPAFSALRGDRCRGPRRTGLASGASDTGENLLCFQLGLHCSLFTQVGSLAQPLVCVRGIRPLRTR